MDREERIKFTESLAPEAANTLVLFSRFGRLLLALLRDARVPRYLKVLAAGVVTYVALPFDALPDFAPVAGMGDDLLVIFLTLVEFMKRCPEDALREHWDAIIGDPREVGDRLRQAAATLQPYVGARFGYLDETISRISERLTPKMAEEQPS